VHLRVNGAPHAVASNCTLAELLDVLGIERGRIAIAVNRDVVPRSAYANHQLAGGDQVEILEAAGGG
jgi:sulfur carrier protein